MKDFIPYFIIVICILIILYCRYYKTKTKTKKDNYNINDVQILSENDIETNYVKL